MPLLWCRLRRFSVVLLRVLHLVKTRFQRKNKLVNYICEERWSQLGVHWSTTPRSPWNNCRGHCACLPITLPCGQQHTRLLKRPQCRVCSWYLRLLLVMSTGVLLFTLVAGRDLKTHPNNKPTPTRAPSATMQAQPTSHALRAASLQSAVMRCKRLRLCQTTHARCTACSLVFSSDSERMVPWPPRI